MYIVSRAVSCFRIRLWLEVGLSLVGGMSIGTPVKLLYEGIGHIITAESCNGLLYRGTLVS